MSWSVIRSGEKESNAPKPLDGLFRDFECFCDLPTEMRVLPCQLVHRLCVLEREGSVRGGGGSWRVRMRHSERTVGGCPDKVTAPSRLVESELDFEEE